MLYRLFLTFVFLAVLAALAVVLAGAHVRYASRGRSYARIEEIPHRQVGVVLGCIKTLSNGRPNLYFHYRIAAAIELFNSGKVDFLLVSGDNHRIGYDETTDMMNALVEAGIPPGHIYCDYAGFRTLDSMVRAKAIFGQQAITVISQAFHNQRAIYIARAHGIDAVGFDATPVTRREAIKTNAREQLARVKAVLDVYVLRKRPRFLGPGIQVGEQSPQERPEVSKS